MIYLDNHSTTQLDPQVLEAMLPWLQRPANTGAKHALGQQAQEAVQVAREQVARLVGADPVEIVFTSGATESNNLAIRGALSKGSHAITSTYEHKAVLEPLRRHEATGQLSLVRVGEEGVVSPESVSRAIRNDTRFVSVMWANNEVGTINDIPEIGQICREKGIWFHSDAAQAVGKVPIDVKAAGVGLLSMSAHKFHGPQGVGALFVSRSKPRVVIESLFDGGGQERRMRSGTLNVAGIVGFGKACAIALEQFSEQHRIAELRDRLFALLQEMIPGTKMNGSRNRLAGNLNVSLPGVYAPDLVKMVGGRVAISNGSACNTSLIEPSHVLMAMGLSPDRAHAAVRFGLSKWTTKDDVEEAAKVVSDAAKKIKIVQ